MYSSETDLITEKKNFVQLKITSKDIMSQNFSMVLNYNTGNKCNKHTKKSFERLFIVFFILVNFE